ncbi:MAG: FKBP-type peptidyl-prolyl cis-trans isomerase [Bacteroidales bacterium]|nr:FKBP-type peptidyl-prolyl cis-trans isomerase [Bacteroidales bacterium]
MKKIMKNAAFVMAVSAVLALGACSSNYSIADKNEAMFAPASRIDSVSYSLGMWMGGTILGSGVGEVNYAELMAGLKDVLNEKETRIQQNEVNQVISSYLMERQGFLMDKNLSDGVAFMEQHKTEEGVEVSTSGLQYRIIKPGNEVKATQDGDTVSVFYTGKFINGEVFDATPEGAEPVSFPLNRVIRGWTEGLKLIGEGGKIELVIPAELAYGPQNYNGIPGNSVLVFDVELVKVKPVKVSE